MNAKEFIRKFGWGVAERTLKNSEGCDYLKLYGSYKFTHADLKKYIDAYELVQKFGGLPEAKKYIDNQILPELSRAISLVEEINS